MNGSPTAARFFWMLNDIHNSRIDGTRHDNEICRWGCSEKLNPAGDGAEHTGGTAHRTAPARRGHGSLDRGVGGGSVGPGALDTACGYASD